MAVLHYKDPATGQWIPIVSGPRGDKGDKGDKGDPGGVAGPPGAAGATTHSALTDLALQKDEHPQYLKAAGDILEGGLNIINDVAELTFLINGVKKFGLRSQSPDTLTLLRYTSPTTLDTIATFYANGNVVLSNSNGTLDIQMVLRVLHTVSFAKSPTFTLGANMNNQKITNVLTPTAANDAVNKAYADTVAVGVGGIYNMSESIPTGTAAHWLNGIGSPHVWGGMSSGADHLLVQKNGYYRCSFNATYSTNVTGNVREVRLAVSGGDQTGIPANSFHIGATATPNSWGGWGLNLSASGVWHLNAGNGIRIMARQDSGINLFCSATLTMELVDPA